MTQKSKKAYEELLSSYTIASNCTDLTDVLGGISDMQEVIEKLEKQNTKIPAYFRTRLKKLEEKKLKFQKPIYLVGVEGEKWYNLNQYVLTVDDGIKMGIKLNKETFYHDKKVTSQPIIEKVDEKDQITTFSYSVYLENSTYPEKYFIYIKELTIFK